MGNRQRRPSGQDHPIRADQALGQRIVSLHWPFVVGLGALALVRPLMNIVGLTDELGRPLIPLLLTLVISGVWIAVVGLSRVPEPMLTLVFAGLVYAGLSTVLSAILSPIIEGELQGPLATPLGIGVLSVLLVNAIWGATTGAAALLVRKMSLGRDSSRYTWPDAVPASEEQCGTRACVEQRGAG